MPLATELAYYIRAFHLSEDAVGGPKLVCTVEALLLLFFY